MLLISALALGLVETANLNICGQLRGIGLVVGTNLLAAVATAELDAGINSETIAGAVANSIGAGNVVHHHISSLGVATGIANNVVNAASSTNSDTSVSIAHTTNAFDIGNGISSSNNPASGTITWDNNGTLRSAGPNDWSIIEQCLYWQRPHHLYFQLGNAFFLLAFLAPHSPFGMLWLRTFLVIGSVLMAMYGYLIECMPDVVLWSALYLFVNCVYLIVLICRLRPLHFEKEIEAVYASLFKPLRVSRHQFKKILDCMKLIRSLKYQEVYAQEKVTKVDSLSLVLSGKLVVSQNQRALHIVFSHQFLDSPEWFGVSTDDYFQVSIMAMEESRILIWHRDKLKLSIMTEPFLQSVFDHILGRDVVKKLMQVTQVSESIASNGFLPSGGYADDAEDKPMLIMKKTVEGHGLTALINRQLQEEHAPLLGRTYSSSTMPISLLKPPSPSSTYKKRSLSKNNNYTHNTAAAANNANNNNNNNDATITIVATATATGSNGNYASTYSARQATKSGNKNKTNNNNNKNKKSSVYKELTSPC